MNMIESGDRDLGVLIPGNILGSFHHERKVFDEIITGSFNHERNSPRIRSVVPPPYSCAGHKRSSTCSDVNGSNSGHQPASAHQPNFAEETKKVTECIAMDLYNPEQASSELSSIFTTQMIGALLDDIKQEFEVADVTDEEANLDDNAVVEYIDDLYAYYKEDEICHSFVPNYMSQQPHIDERARAMAIDWLIELHCHFELREEALYLMVNLVDRFLAVQAVDRWKLDLVGMAALLLACKYEGSGLAIDDFLEIGASNDFSRKELLDMEKEMADVLEFKLSVPTPYMFMSRFLKAAESDKNVEDLSFFILDLCLLEYDMLRFPPSLLAAAAVYTSQCTLNCSKKWTATCEKYTNYSEDQLLECSKMMVNLHKKAGTCGLNGVVRKYLTDRYGYVANAQPARFLLEN